jgi:hypothetical protein
MSYQESYCNAPSGITNFRLSNTRGDTLSAKLISTANGCRLLEVYLETRTCTELPFLAWAHGEKGSCALLATRRLTIGPGIAVKYPDDTVEDHLGQIWPSVDEWLNSFPK